MLLVLQEHGCEGGALFWQVFEGSIALSCGKALRAGGDSSSVSYDLRNVDTIFSKIRLAAECCFAV